MIQPHAKLVCHLHSGHYLNITRLKWNMMGGVDDRLFETKAVEVHKTKKLGTN